MLGWLILLFSAPKAKVKLHIHPGKKIRAFYKDEFVQEFPPSQRGHLSFYVTLSGNFKKLGDGNLCHGFAVLSHR